MQSKPLPEYPIVIEMPVRWGDMDAFQHVNNIMYFRYFESSRIAYFDALDLHRFMTTDGIGPILGSTSCRFRLPVTYPDTLSVGARVTEVGEDRLTMEHAVYSHRHERLAATGEGVVVFFDYRNNRKHPIPAEIVARIQGLEGQPQPPVNT